METNIYSVANFDFSKRMLNLNFLAKKAKMLATLKKLDAGSS